MAKKKQAETTPILLTDVITSTEAAAASGMSAQTFDRQRAKGKIPQEIFVKFRGRTIGCDKNKLQEWLASQAKTGTGGDQ